jgi:hypothetical protein
VEKYSPAKQLETPFFHGASLYVLQLRPYYAKRRLLNAMNICTRASDPLIFILTHGSHSCITAQHWVLIISGSIFSVPAQILVLVLLEPFYCGIFILHAPLTLEQSGMRGFILYSYSPTSSAKSAHLSAQDRWVKFQI